MIRRLGLGKALIAMVGVCAGVSLIFGYIFVQLSSKSLTQMAQAAESGFSQLLTMSKKNSDELKIRSSVIRVIGLWHSNVMPAVSEKDKDTLEIYLEIVGGFEKETFDNLKACGTGCVEVAQIAESYRKEWHAIQTELKKGPSEQATQLALTKLNPLFDKMLSELDKGFASTIKTTEEDLAKANASTSQIIEGATADNARTSNILLLATLITSIGLFGVGLVFKKVIFQIMSEITSTLLTNLEENRTVTEKITLGVHQLSSATTQQAAAVTESNATVQNINTMVKSNSKSAQLSKEMSERTTVAAQAGGRMVGDMNEVIQTIHQNSSDIVAGIESMHAEFDKIIAVIEEIGSKTRVINDIVFQTKLLSFNASVEAARAGEHGKGFAVVAEEVGNLAAMSGKAAHEISALLSESRGKVHEIIQGGKDRMVQVLIDGKEAINKGNSLAENTGNSLAQILEYATQLQDMTSQVSQASEQQANGLREMQTAMDELDSTTLQNSQTAEAFTGMLSELEVRSRELQQISGELAGVVYGAAAAHAKKAA